jgi:hypothetical protein
MQAPAAECGRWQVGICGLFCLGQGSSRKKANKRCIVHRFALHANGRADRAICFPETAAVIGNTPNSI